ncbi:hypothetical protein BDZ91DRAFT_828204 [Kalaharituber pfeilii]|nr:hypothetical protein BDZ91DRAFT_828204 [Kalaharituber pfeilii]
MELEEVAQVLVTGCVTGASSRTYEIDLSLYHDLLEVPFKKAAKSHISVPQDIASCSVRKTDLNFAGDERGSLNCRLPAIRPKGMEHLKDPFIDMDGQKEVPKLPSRSRTTDIAPKSSRTKLVRQKLTAEGNARPGEPESIFHETMQSGRSETSSSASGIQRYRNAGKADNFEWLKGALETYKSQHEMDSSFQTGGELRDATSRLNQTMADSIRIAHSEENLGVRGSELVMSQDHRVDLDTVRQNLTTDKPCSPECKRCQKNTIKRDAPLQIAVSNPSGETAESTTSVSCTPQFGVKNTHPPLNLPSEADNTLWQSQVSSPTYGTWPRNGTSRVPVLINSGAKKETRGEVASVADVPQATRIPKLADTVSSTTSKRLSEHHASEPNFKQAVSRETEYSASVFTETLENKMACIKKGTKVRKEDIGAPLANSFRNIDKGGNKSEPDGGAAVGTSFFDKTKARKSLNKPKTFGPLGLGASTIALLEHSFASVHHPSLHGAEAIAKFHNRTPSHNIAHIALQQPSSDSGEHYSPTSAAINGPVANIPEYYNNFFEALRHDENLAGSQSLLTLHTLIEALNTQTRISQQAANLAVQAKDEVKCLKKVIDETLCLWIEGLNQAASGHTNFAQELPTRSFISKLQVPTKPQFGRSSGYCLRLLACLLPWASISAVVPERTCHEGLQHLPAARRRGLVPQSKQGYQAAKDKKKSTTEKKVLPAAAKMGSPQAMTTSVRM